MYWVYFMYSKNKKNTYVGCTGNLKKRLKEHQDGLVELMLNRIVYALIPKMPNLTEDEVVDLVYELINDLESPFTFYVQCMAAEGVLEAIRVEDQSNGNSPISDYIVSVLGKDYRER